MAFDHSRFTLMCFPQHVDASGKLTLNIVFLPRNISPLDKVNTTFAPGGKAAAFVDVKPNFEIKVVNEPNDFPGKVIGNFKVVAPVSPFTYPANISKLYLSLRDAKDQNGKPKYFDIDPTRSSDNAGSAKHRANAPVEKTTALRKYLPESYRASFNFTSPRVRNAVTDDSYHCAMRDKTKPPAIVHDNKVSWGKVYAHLLRQPLMAREGGLLYKTSIQLAPGDFKKGGWLYVDIKSTSTYGVEQTASLASPNGPFIKRYAARIPALKAATERTLFAAILFPVVHGIDPAGTWDELFIEAARFNEGFATIVHANQPKSHNLLREDSDGNHPQKEVGIRLGWEDEQILIWYLRQMSVDENIGTDRIDAPIGVMGYHIDVKDDIADGTEWESLTAVTSNGALELEGINIGNYDGELPYQVYPSKVHSLAGSDFWLPMYFSNWNNASLVIPDRAAALLYANDRDKNKPVKISDTYNAPEYNTKLLYGQTYFFRVRLSDISGGGPDAGVQMNAPSPSQIASAPFKRYVAPNSIQIIQQNAIIDPGGKNMLKVNTDDANFDGDSLELGRPLLGYPAVVYTGKYADAVSELKKVSDQYTNNNQGGTLGIPDPDVVKVEILVEVETLQLDNLASDDGREHYITLYKTFRHFNATDFSETIKVGMVFRDYPVLNLEDSNQPFDDAAANDAIAATEGDIFLPTARDIRITLRGIGEGNDTYWGNTSNHPKYDTRYGKTTSFKLRRESEDETKLIRDTSKDPKMIQGIYLQPDAVVTNLDAVTFKMLQGVKEGMPDIVERLGKQIDVAVNKMTLTAENGERIHFWCSNLVRHSLAPDNSSITFANKTELTDHWLVCINLYLDRDWTWDALATSSFNLYRKRTTDTGNLEASTKQFIGDLEVRRIASFQAIQEGIDEKVHREYTRIVLIDVLDMKGAANTFPNETVVQYFIEPKFKTGLTPLADEEFFTPSLELPTTINPVQVPKVIGAGVALSPYQRNEKYSTTEARQRYLWLEFDSKPHDKNDGLFARVLAYAADQLLSNNHPDQMMIPKEPPLPIDPEYIRVITPATAHENAGLNAMQLMEKAADPSRHFYLLPLPPGLHHESAELFGFFTYEFRYGHTDKVWSTAQGRFGRPFRLTGLQHPAPNSYCMVNRDEKIISVSAPYAQAAFNGKNVTSNPPRTTIWCLLYAQVKQADGLEYRNILLDEQELRMLPPSRHREMMRPKFQQAVSQGNKLLLASLSQQLSQLEALDKDSVIYANGEWQNKEVNERLRLYGLPIDAPLSVIAVEVFGNITNIHEHINNFRNVAGELEDTVTSVFNNDISADMRKNYAKAKDTSIPATKPDMPLTDNLGMCRILRTSPLTEVPFICCT